MDKKTKNQTGYNDGAGIYDGVLCNPLGTFNKVSMDGIDPTLDACCQREEENSRKQSALEAMLRSNDRIHKAEMRRRNILPNVFDENGGCRCCYDPNSDGGEYGALIDARQRLVEEETYMKKITNEDNELKNMGEIDGDEHKLMNHSDSDSDSEFDYLLDEELPVTNTRNVDTYAEFITNPYPDTGVSYEQSRIMQLQNASLFRESALHHGFGAHRQIHPSRVFRLAGLDVPDRSRCDATVPPAVVLHLYDPGSILSANLDLCLEDLATKYLGTKFLRGNGRTTLILQNSNGANRNSSSNKSFHGVEEKDLPAILAIRNGTVINICPKLLAFANSADRDGVIETHAVEHWLQGSGVLLDEVTISYDDLCSLRMEELALHENILKEQQDMKKLYLPQNKEDFYECGVKGCCKTFRHEHVGIETPEQTGLLVKEEDIIADKNNS